MNSASNTSALRADAPKLRTIESIYRKHEQVLDAIERNALQPKQIDGLNTTLKGMVKLGIELELRYMSMVAKFRQHLPMPKGDLLRNALHVGEGRSERARGALLEQGDVDE